MRLLTFAILLCGSAWAQEVRVFPVQGDVSMLVGPGGNITVQAGKEGMVVVDTQTAAAAPQVMAAIRKLSDMPIIWVINTSLDADHIGGNEALLRLGGSNEASLRARVVAHENVLNRLVRQLWLRRACRTPPASMTPISDRPKISCSTGKR
jgi:cyclase